MTNALNTNLGMTGYEWSTHQPLIKAAMDLFKPQFVLELGMGDNSTPIFLSYKTKLLSIENDAKWIDYIKSKYGQLDTIYHDLEDPAIKLGTHLYELKESQKQKITSFYNNLVIPDIKPNLLFVDQFTSCRTLSINALGEKFDVIIYHDCQAAGIPWYSYDLINIKGFTVYYLKTNTSWTGIFVRDAGVYNELKRIIIPYIQLYKSQNIGAESMTF